MALRELTNQEVGERIRWVRREANKTTRGLADEMGERSSNLLTRLEQGASHTPQRIKRVARLCSGQGTLINDEELIWRFLVGEHADRSDLVREPLHAIPANAKSSGGSATKVCHTLKAA